MLAMTIQVTDIPSTCSLISAGIQMIQVGKHILHLVYFIIKVKNVKIHKTLTSLTLVSNTNINTSYISFKNKCLGKGRPY